MSAAPAPQPARRRSMWRRVAIVIGGIFVVLILLTVGAAWYATTPKFENIVRNKVVATLENATGGRVELGYFRWRLLHLEFEADNLTIHGLEAPGEVPYAHVDRLFVRAKVISFMQKKIGLNLLQAEHPVIHLIVYPDGSTNQPKPKTVSNNKPVTDTLFDLAVDRTEVTNGLVLLNQRAIPFNVAANDLSAAVTYSMPRDHYLASLQASDVSAQRGKAPATHSQLNLQADLGRNSANLSQLRLQTGFSSKNRLTLDMSGSIANYAAPRFQVAADGEVDVRAVTALTGVEGLDGGIAELHLKGQGTTAKFAVDGQAKLAGGGYRMATVRLNGVNASTAIHLTQDEIALTSLKARLPQGGSLDGELHIVNWLTASPSGPSAQKASMKPPVGPVSRGTIRAQIRDITLSTLMQIVAPPRYRDLGFETAATGHVGVDWTGNANDLRVSANVALNAPATVTAGRVPLSGNVDATYFNRGGSVQLRQLVAQTPATHVQAQGSLGVYPLEGRSDIQADLTTTNLGEFDRTLTALGLSTTGQAGTKTGVKAIPVELHGQAEFHGDVTGSLLSPDVKGHLTATNFDTVFANAASPTSNASASLHAVSAVAQSAVTPSLSTAAAPAQTDIHWDRLDTLAEYSEQLISIQQATLTRGTTTVHASGELHAHQISRRKTAFDEHSAVNANVTVQHATLTDLLAMAGSTAPVSGTLDLHANVGGTVGNLSGGGHVAIQGGQIYGEPYHSLNTDLRFAGQQLDANNLKFLQDGGQITGDGGYNFKAKSVHFKAQGTGFQLAHFHQLQSPRAAIGGQLTFDATGSGTMQSPAAQAHLHIAGLTINSEFKGALEAEAHTGLDVLYITSNSTLNASQIQLSGQMALSGNYQTQAHLTASNILVEPYLHYLKVEGVVSRTPINLQATISGPAKQPKLMNGTLDVNQFSVGIGSVQIKTDGAMHAQLRDGVVHLDPLRILGDDTNLRALGSVAVFQPSRALDLHASGAVNLKLAQTFDPNIISSGHVDFFLDATGTLQRPSLAGQVKFTNAAIALEDLPNGLSQMNGTLIFDQDRLQVQNLTATTGGGQLQIGGYVTYQQGIYGDLTATGKDIRVRYPQGVSSMADAKLRLQGTESNLLLSGSVVVTRFSISPNLDLAALSSTSTAAAPPPDPNAPSNHVRLDIHITSAPELNFQNSYAKLAGDVDLRIRGTLATPAVLGHISISDGSATFAGTTYQLQRGDIYFSNPIHIDPLIDLDATARVEDYDINIGLHGTISKLNLTYRSEPPLPEADIFALLALGRTQEEQQIYSQEQQSAGVNSTADALLGGALNATLSSRVQKLFGVGSVKIDPTFLGSLGNSTARITVEQQISRNATLTYATNVNSTAQQLIQGQLYVTPNVAIVAQRDESGVFSLLVKVHKRLR